MADLKEDLHVDRLIRFRTAIEDPPTLVTPPTNPQTIQELIMVPLFFSFPEGGTVT